jgi:transposase-like protein
VPAHRGSAHHLAVLTEDAVRIARQEAASGTATVKELALRFGVSAGAMRRAINGLTWKHLITDTAQETPDAA